MTNLKAWIQMGVERRETTFQIPDRELVQGRGLLEEEPALEWGDLLERYAADWCRANYSWGWSSDLTPSSRYVYPEGREAQRFLSVVRSAIPNTRAFRLDLNRELVRSPHTNLWLPPGTPGPQEEKFEPVSDKILENEPTG